MNPSLLLSNQSVWVLIKTYEILELLDDEKRLTLELKSDSLIVFLSHVGLCHRKVFDRQLSLCRHVGFQLQVIILSFAMFFKCIMSQVTVVSFT